MRYSILGPIEVVADDGRRIDLGTPRQRAVLAILLLNANHVVSLDRLIDELWGETPPGAATSSLQAYVSNLRRLLEPDRPPRAPATVLVSQPPGYVLRCAPDALDAACFEAEAEAGRRLLTTDPEAARPALDQAIGRWRGPLLADLAFEAFVTPWAARLDEMRASAEEDRIDALLACGDTAPAVAELETMVAAEPLRERRRAQQMLALYRAGRQADALRAYDSARTQFVDELGLEPSPALQSLQQQVLDHDASLAVAAPPQPAPPAVAEPTSSPLAAAASSAPHGGQPFVGRDASLHAIASLLDDVRAGVGAVAVVTGEAGIGKTRLCEAVAADAVARGWQVAWGRGYDDEGAPPLWPWVQTLRVLLPGVALEPAVRDDLASILPELGGQAAASSDPESARFRQFEAVGAALRAAAAAQPILIVLDDIHWADASSLRLLRFVATYVRDAALMLLVTAREREGKRAAAVLETIGDLVRQPAGARIVLEPLSSADIAEYVHAVAGAEASEIAGAVVERSDGNPFFVAELVKLIVSESGRAGANRAELSVPAAIGDVIRRRVARLPDNSQALLQIAAASGRWFDVDVVAHAARLELDAAYDALDPAIVTGVLVDGGDASLRFSHALVSEVIEADLPAVRRARVHLDLARALTVLRANDLDAHLADVGRHLDLAGALAPAEDVIAHGRRAAERATAQLAFDEAVVARERVVRALLRVECSDRDRLDALIELGIAKLHAGDLAGALAMQGDFLDLAERAGDVETVARAALAYESFAASPWRGFGVVFERMVAALDWVLARLDPGDSPLRARAMAALGDELYYDDERREAGFDLAREALAMAERLEDPALLAHAAFAVIVAGRRPGCLAEQRHAVDQLLAIEPGRLTSEQRAARVDQALLLTLRAGAVTDFPAAVDRATPEVMQERDPASIATLSWAQATAHYFRGDVARAEAAALEAFAVHQRTGSWGAIEGLAVHMQLVRRAQGRQEEFAKTIDDLELVDMPRMSLLRAVVAVGLDDLDTARRLFPKDPFGFPRDFGWLPFTANLAYVAAAARLDCVEGLYEVLLPFRAEVTVIAGTFASYGSTEHYLGLLAEVFAPARAAAHFEAAIAMHDRIAAQPWAEESRRALARVR